MIQKTMRADYATRGPRWACSYRGCMCIPPSVAHFAGRIAMKAEVDEANPLLSELSTHFGFSSCPLVVTGFLAFLPSRRRRQTDDFRYRS